MENIEDRINPRIIEKYKKDITNVMKSKKFDLKEKVEDNLQKLLDMDFRNHKITEKEYDILNDFLQEQLETYFEIDLKSTSEINSNSNNKVETIDSAKKFREELKKLPILDVTPIYKGQYGVKAPKRKKNENQEKDKER
ncbi:MAG: hypothetical protein J6A29_00490 [Clostridia bacterium]|nr:hypothetical protein [Clostridia bacterium]